MGEDGDHGGEIEPVVEAPFELGEGAHEVLLVDGAVGGNDGALDVAEHRVRPFERRMACRTPARSGRDREMRAAGVRDASEADEPVGHHPRTRRDDALRKALHATALEACDAPQLDPARPAVVGRLDRHDDRLLAWAAATGLSAAALAAEIGVVHLDPPVERRAVVGDAHHLGELGLDLPRRGLRDAEPAAQLDRGDALLGLRDQVHGAEPRREADLRRREDRAGGERGLRAAGIALIERASGQHAVLTVTTRRAHEAVGPAPSCERLAAPRLGPIEDRKTGLRETLLKLDAVAGHAHLPDLARYSPEPLGRIMAERGA